MLIAKCIALIAFLVFVAFACYGLWIAALAELKRAQMYEAITVLLRRGHDEQAS